MSVGSIAGNSAPTAQPAVAAAHHSAFRELLSELNPLQYLPVIGTIYRAVTGDTIPQTARNVGSLVVSGLTGGPVGLALAVGALAVEDATGIDPETIGRRVLAGMGIGDVPRRAAGTVQETMAKAPAAAGGSSAGTLLPARAAGVQRDDDNSADRLNGLELARLHGAGTNLVA